MKNTFARNYSTASYILPAPVRTAPVVATKQLSADEQEYLEWKKANGLDRRLSREQYEVVFNIY